MFQSVEAAPPDAILGLTEAFRKDENSSKVNLGVGVYKAEDGTTPLLKSVKVAEQRILEGEKTKTYVNPNNGTAEYTACVQRMLFGDSSDIVDAGRAVSAHTPGGTGALRLAGDYLRLNHAGATIWLSDPTWANHGGIFADAGVPTKKYGYYDAETYALDFDRMLTDLGQVPAGDVVLLHACCHNPTGVDPSEEQWNMIAERLAERGAVPLIDFAYQGFAAGLEEDANAVRVMSECLPELMVCSSFSKNFGLYCERVGALTVVASDASNAANVLSQVKRAIRRNYSNPPAHGSLIVTTILGDDALAAQWRGELKEMRDRINGMRRLFADSLDARGTRLGRHGNGFIVDQKGMFSFSGLGPGQVKALQSEHSIYIVGDGRINVAGMTTANMDGLCDAITAVAGGG